MEELNAKSPLLASAITGSKKKLLYRVKRLLSPVKLRKGFSEGIIALILLIGLILTLSVNALSFIPNAYDLTGRESGESVYSLIPPHNIIQSIAGTEKEITSPETEKAVQAVTPDTIIAKSKTGNVSIKVYTDSTSKDQQEMLNHMAESMDKQAGQYNKAVQEYQIQIEKFDDEKENMNQECKVIVIRKSDSLCSVPPDGSQFNYYYSNPEPHDLGDCKQQFFTIKIDSIDGLDALDTVIFMGSGACLNLGGIEGLEGLEGMEWSAGELQKQMKEYQIEEFLDTEYPPFPPPDRHSREFYNEIGTAAPAERIIRQELVDDGLATPHKKYVIDIDSHGMYINGEKQSKDTYRKYKHLVESLDVTDLEDDGTYRLIF
jgi:hypothetical protein